MTILNRPLMDAGKANGLRGVVFGGSGIIGCSSQNVRRRVKGTTEGDKPCWWPATSREQAEGAAAWRAGAARTRRRCA